MSEKKILIYSKDRCPYCDMARRTFENMDAEFTELKLGADFTREELLEAAPNARTFPQIFIGDELIGGYQELKKYIEETGFDGK